jgi:hypothetical protein
MIKRQINRNLPQMNKPPKRQQKHMLVKATENASIREVDENSKVVRGVIRYVGKEYDAKEKTWNINPDGVVVPCLAYYIQQVKAGYLIPMNEEAASHCGVVYAPKTTSETSSNKEL